jgi:hypothetical protein
MDATIAFYQKLGLTPAYETKIDCRVCFLRRGNLVIEAYENGAAVLNSGAVDHIALDCTDINAAYSEAQKAGFEFEFDGIQTLPFWKNGVAFFKIIGPNRETVEFCQIL